jgi:hypothetical protein
MRKQDFWPAALRGILSAETMIANRRSARGQEWLLRYTFCDTAKRNGIHKGDIRERWTPLLRVAVGSKRKMSVAFFLQSSKGATLPSTSVPLDARVKQQKLFAISLMPLG